MSFESHAQRPPFYDEGYGFDLFGLHPPAVERAVAAGAPFYDHYFRVDSRGVEQIPETGPAILVANHGGVLPLDAAMLCLDVLRQTRRLPRAIADHFVPRLPIVGTLFARIGVVSGARRNVERLLERGELVAIWPEGVTGPAKPFRSRYQIQQWRVGFAELAIRYRAPVIPAAVVGAEESWPMAKKLPGLRWFGVPYMPIPAFPVPLPTKLYIRYGQPIRFDRVAADDPAVVAEEAHRVRVAIEQLIDETREERRRDQ
ncbi:MAG TPA: lysophospholipid acyltransferase family protein [Kofleriaceae bacterium]|nr:lysophospholipid acyltransferase family protein [Kofleriaceae bacterium]